MKKEINVLNELPITGSFQVLGVATSNGELGNKTLKDLFNPEITFFESLYFCGP